MADSKVTALSTLAALTGDETLYIIEDDDGTPASRQMTIEDFLTAIAARTELTAAFAAKTNTLWLPAGLFGASTGGSPVISNLSDDIAVWLLDQTTIESVSTTVMLPAHWVTFTAQIVWTVSSGSGNVVLNMAYRSGWGDTESIGVNVAGSNTAATAVPSGLTSKWTTALTGIAVPSAGEILSLRVRRVANDAGDTFAGDIGIVGVVLTKAS